MRILVTGLCTLHWGRLEFGNIGNYYIIEPLFRQLHRAFPDAQMITTFQMTREFSERENVSIIPMSYYYAWNEDDVKIAYEEYGIASYYSATGQMAYSTPYIDILNSCQLVIDVSGDMWGDNAEHVGKNRFLVDLLKMRTAQLFSKKTVLFAGTPGPFSSATTTEMAKDVFRNFSLVINREPEATKNLKAWGFDITKVFNFACPSFLFNPVAKETILPILQYEGFLREPERPLIGFTICGFNMPNPPYDKWPRDDNEYSVFASVVEYIVNVLGARVMLISHTNGFELPPNFKLIHGRDHVINMQLKQVIEKRGRIRNVNDVAILSCPYIPRVMKALIGQFDMFVTGRLHASVGAISQFVPTVFIMHGKDYIRSTKIQGFAELAQLSEYVCEPDDAEAMIKKIGYCYENRDTIRVHLHQTIPLIQQMSEASFDMMKSLIEAK